METGASEAGVERRLRELERRAREYRAEAMLLDAELRQAQREVPTMEAAVAWFREAHRTLEDGTDDERRESISHIAKRVEMTPKNEVQVEYCIPPALTADEAHGLKLHQHWLPMCNPLHNHSRSPAVN